MIKATKGPRNSSLALCVCDDCLVEVSFDAVHEGGHGENRVIMLQKLALKNPGAVSRRLQAMGWVESGKRLRCKACEAKRKQTTDATTIAAGSAKGADMKPEQTNVTQLREPSQKQKRLIIMALEDDYDDAAKRYKGNKTDKTLADDLGDGILFGWVARIREDLFGPDGANDEIEAVEAAIKKLSVEAADLGRAVTLLQATSVKLTNEQAALAKRIIAIKSAVGPRAASA